MAGQLSALQQQEKLHYDRHRDALADRDTAYNRLLALMTGYGYRPTAGELSAAGMSDAQMKAILRLI